MKIIDWFKNLFLKTKKEYRLNESNDTINVKQDRTNFVPKVNINSIEYRKTREDILKDLSKDIIIEDLSEQYNYTKFSPENMKEKKDLLSNEDIKAISCLYGAIKDGNMWHSKTEVVDGEIKTKGNKIIEFLKETPNNIIVLINLMEEEAKNAYDNYQGKEFNKTTLEDLIPGSYGDISELIDNYTKENEIEQEKR